MGKITYIKKFRILGILIIVGLAVLWALLALFFSRFLSPQLSYILSILVSSAFASFLVGIVGRHGLAILFYMFGALFTYGIDDLGVVGANKIIVLIIVGLVFEISLLISRMLTSPHKTAHCVVCATAISAASIPITTGMIISSELVLGMLYPTLNMVLLAFITGLAGGLISILVLLELGTTKTILRFRYLLK